MSTTYLSRTPSSASNRKTWTWSAWLKRAVKSDSNNSRIFAAGTGSSDYTSWYMYAPEGTDGTLQFQNRISGTTTSVALNRKFMDVSGWYHLVVACDTTQATDSNRLKIYVNGVQETSFSTFNPPAQNVDTYVNNNNSHTIGSADTTGYTPRYWAGSMSHINFVDGTAYDASAFGQIDATTGEWSIITSPNVTYGTNGYFILKDGNSVTDQSPNTNNWTVAGGTLTNTEDNPSNVFCTMNPLSAGSDMTFGNGNTKIRNDVGTWNSGVGTIAPGTGKYYWEVYVHGGGDNNTGVTLSSAYGGNHSEVDAGRVVYSRNGYIYREGLSGQNNYDTGVTYGDTDIIGVAFDTENGTLSFYKNGSAVSNSTTTDTSFLRSNNEYLPQCGLYNGGEFRFNFGNGYFGTTAVSSAGTNASNIGIFEYDVPTGYTALSTKGLNE